MPESGRYRLGLRLLELGGAVAARLDLRQVARPHLQALVEETGETATLSAPGEREAITVDFVQSPASVQSVARLGRPSVAHATATGKILLAFGPSPLPHGRLVAHTGKTITRRPQLAAELARVRKLGHAASLGEREPDLHAVAAPVFGSRTELVAIIGVQGPAERFRDDAIEAACVLRVEHARLVSSELGGSAPAR